jgi:hypothetical protein
MSEVVIIHLYISNCLCVPIDPQRAEQRHQGSGPPLVATDSCWQSQFGPCVQEQGGGGQNLLTAKIVYWGTPGCAANLNVYLQKKRAV